MLAGRRGGGIGLPVPTTLLALLGLASTSCRSRNVPSPSTLRGRNGVLARRGGFARRRRRRHRRCAPWARAARRHPRPDAIEHRGRGRVRVQARAHPRRRVRPGPEGEARAPPFPVRDLARRTTRRTGGVRRDRRVPPRAGLSGGRGDRAHPEPAPTMRAATALAQAADKAERREGSGGGAFYERALGPARGDRRGGRARAAPQTSADPGGCRRSRKRARATPGGVPLRESRGRLDLRCAALIALANVNTKQGRAAESRRNLTDAVASAAEIGGSRASGTRALRVRVLRRVVRGGERGGHRPGAGRACDRGVARRPVAAH